MKCYFCNSYLFQSLDSTTLICRKCPTVEPGDPMEDVFSSKYMINYFTHLQKNINFYAYAWNDNELKARLRIDFCGQPIAKKFSIEQLRTSMPIFTSVNSFEIEKYSPEELKKKVKSILTFI